MLNLLLWNITVAQRKPGCLFIYTCVRDCGLSTLYPFSSLSLLREDWLYLGGCVSIVYHIGTKSARKAPKWALTKLMGLSHWLGLLRNKLNPGSWPRSGGAFCNVHSPSCLEAGGSCGCNHRWPRRKEPRNAENPARSFVDPWTDLPHPQIKATNCISFVRPLLLDSLTFPHEFTTWLAKYPLLLGKRKIFTRMCGNECHTTETKEGSRELEK